MSARVPIDPRNIRDGHAFDNDPDYDDFHWNDEEPVFDADEPPGWEPWSLQGGIG